MVCCGARGCARGITASRRAPVWSISLLTSCWEKVAGASAMRTLVHCKVEEICKGRRFSGLL